MKERTFKLWAILLLVTGLAALPMALADDALPHNASAPASSEPATHPIVQIQTWYQQLAAPEADVREQARIDLMSLQRADLETLREVVKASLPPSAAQSSALRDIVTQVYLAGEDYESLPTGFLGVKLVVDRPVVLGQDQAAGESRISGVPVDEAMPGFCAYGLLQPGDLIYQVDSTNRTLTPTASELIQLVSSTPPGHVITLHLLRQGRLVRVSLRLSARPRGVMDAPSAQQFFNDRARLAEQYWATHFAELVEHGIG